MIIIMKDMVSYLKHVKLLITNWKEFLTMEDKKPKFIEKSNDELIFFITPHIVEGSFDPSLM